MTTPDPTHTYFTPLTIILALPLTWETALADPPFQEKNTHSDGPFNNIDK